MKKILFSLLLLVGLATNVSAQTCLSSTTSPGSIVCAGSNLLWTTASLGANVGDPIIWTITGDTTGGATFVASGSNTYVTVVNAVTPNINSALVHMGPNAGAVTVLMNFVNNPNPNTCSSSGIAKTLSVVGTPSVLRCPSDLGTITAVGTTHFPIPPGDQHLSYTYTLIETGATNNTGVFPGLAPGTYHVRITDGECTSADSAGITILPVDPRPLITHCPVFTEDGSCEYANQDALNAAFKAWMDSFSYEGGFPPVITSTNPEGPVAPPLCGGEITVTWTVRDACNLEEHCTQTFRIIAPPAVVPVNPGNRQLNACDILNPDQLSAAIASWLSEFGANGGCNPQVETHPTGDITSCGGVLHANAVATDRCGVSIPFDATFTVNPAPELITNKPADVHINFCDINPDTLGAQFQAFLDGFTKSGGCAPTLEFLPYVTPNACGGPAITVNAIVKDRCHADVPLSAVFEVKTGTAPDVRGPRGDVNLGACLSQAEIDVALETIKGSITAVNECGPLDVIVGTTGTATKCDGGDIPVTFTINSRCFEPIVITRHLIVAAPTAPTLVCAPNATVSCETPIQHTPPTPAGGCGLLTVNIISTVVSPDGLVSTRTWDVTDECGRHSAECSQTITREVCQDFNGCTLGYWKNHTLAWCTDYKTCTTYGSVFSHAPANLKDLTLLQVLNLGGNSSCENLGRQSVAALLNICEGLPYHIPAIVGAGGLVEQVNAAFDADTCTSLGATLDGFNNEGGANHCNVEFSPNNKKDQCSNAKGVNATGKVATPATTTSFLAYPNPFTSTFSINSTNTVAPVSINVYDMLGRSVETRTFNPDSENELFGGSYPTGIYNVILNQATETRTLRVIKQ